MVYGPLAPRRLPAQDAQRAIFLADRWIRAAEPQSKWAEVAKEAIDFLEGRQWTEAEIAELQAQGRPALKFNKIAPLFRLVMGYYRDNRNDTKFFPGSDALGSMEVSEALTLMHKQFSAATQLPYVDAEVFQDGIATGRGYWDTRLDFEENDLGEVVSRAEDPFAVYPDPDADQYDVDKWNYFCTSRWISRDEIEYTFGKEAADLVGSFLARDGYTQFPQTYYYGPDMTSPVRKFGNEEDFEGEYWNTFSDRWYDFIDPLRKNIRLIESQEWVHERRPVFIDLETGDRSVIPEHWDGKKVEKAMYHAERLGNPMVVAERPVKRVRWSAMVGDLIVYDSWSPYKKFTLTGYFPYFRRGQTRGMIEDLIDPQKEINKRRSAEIEIVMRTNNSGWSYHESSLDPDQEALLTQFGAAPGFKLKWKGPPGNKPEKINPSPPPMAMERLEQKADADLNQISGINQDALGEPSRAVSVRAVLAKQKQAVIGLRMYSDNFKRSKELGARKWLGVVQNHYPEQRVMRIVGEDGKIAETIINQRVNDPGAPTLIDRLTDITIGKYTVVVEEMPISENFKNGQYEEALGILEALGPAGEMILPAVAAEVVELSSMPSSIKMKMREALMGGTSMAGGGAPVPGGAAPGGAEPGNNVVPLQPPAAG